MHQHVRQEPPCLLPLMGVVYEYLCDRSGGIHLALGSIVAKKHDLHQRNEDHTYCGWPAAIFLFVSTVCVREDASAMGLG